MGREALESSSPGFQPSANPSQLPTQQKKPGVGDDTRLPWNDGSVFGVTQVAFARIGVPGQPPTLYRWRSPRTTFLNFLVNRPWGSVSFVRRRNDLSQAIRLIRRLPVAIGSPKTKRFPAKFHEAISRRKRPSLRRFFSFHKIVQNLVFPSSCQRAMCFATAWTHGRPCAGIQGKGPKARVALCGSRNRT